jgi:hypothetical protein
MSETALTTQTAGRLNRMNAAAWQGRLGNRIKDLESTVVASATTVTMTPTGATDIAMTIDGTVITTGAGIRISMVDATLSTGSYILCRGTGAVELFSVKASGDIYSAGTSRFAKKLTATSTSTNLTLDATYYGKTLLWSPATTAAATLPANGAAAGSTIEIILLTDVSSTISAATADTLITDGDLQADSVAFSTTSHKIGSRVIFISNGTYWVACNGGSTTMTVNT